MSVISIPEDLPDARQIEAQHAFETYLFKNLSQLQRDFVDAYLNNKMDVAAAARAVNLCPIDAKLKEARSAGNKLLYEPFITKAIQLALDYYQAKNQVQVETLLRELTTVAYSNVADFFHVDEDGNPTVAMPDTTVHRKKYGAVKMITIETVNLKTGDVLTRVKFELHDKIKAIDSLLRVANMLRDDDDNKATSVHIDTVNIMSVPAGKFLPDNHSTIDGEVTP